MTRTWEVVRFELDYQLRRNSTRIYFLLFIGLAIAAAWSFAVDARRDGYFFNAPMIIAVVTVVSSMFALLIAAGVAGDAATRDEQLRLDSLVYTTPLPKGSYVLGRFFGAFALNTLLLLGVPIGLLLSTLLPGIEPAILGAFRAEAYLTSYFYFAVPNAFVATAVLFSIAAITRNAIAAYGGAAALFFAPFIAEGILGEQLGNWKMAGLVDPQGYTLLHSLWKSLNPIQKKTHLIALDEALLSNRLLWLGVAVTLLALALARYRFAYNAGGGSRRRNAINDDLPPGWTGVAIPAARRSFGMSTRWRQLWAISVRSFRDLVTSRGWFIVPFLAVAFVATAPELLEVELGTPGAATSARVATLIGGTETVRLLVLLIALSAGQLVWRERDARIDAIAGVAPVPEWLIVTGKFLSVTLMLVFSQLVFLLAGVGVQMALDYPLIDLGIYAKILFGFQLTSYLLIAALAMVTHVLVNQKYVANFLVMLVYIGTEMARELGLRHNLLLYGGGPERPYSEMAGFGPQVWPWVWFTLYWSGWALSFGVISYLFWVRGEESGVRTRVALARQRLKGSAAAIGAVALAIIAGTGAFIYYNTNVLNRYYTDSEFETGLVEYERRYRRYASIPQPVLAATKLHVDFYPKRRAATVRGRYRLENRSNTAIDAIHVATHLGLDTRDVTFDRPFRATLLDEEHAHRIYTLGHAMQPGESVTMNFQLTFEPRGFWNNGNDPAVMHNGSWIEHRGIQTHTWRQWLPVIGYQPGREIYSEGTRAKYGLRPRDEDAKLEDAAGRRVQRGIEKIDFEAIVGTDADQIGVTAGELKRTWTENGRRYSHYVADAPMSNGFAIYSARYAVHRTSWRDVAIEIYHHPPHTANLQRMVDSVRASLDYNTREFGPYPHRQLRLIEFPSSGRGLGLTAHEGAIKFSEGYALVRPGDDQRDIDFPFAIMAHEMGHQWWGHKLVPARVEGAAVLSEGLAWYSGMLVIEETYGRDHLKRILDIMRTEYMAPHETRMVSLLRAVDRIDAYRTAPFAMFALREAMGVERVNDGLRNLLAKFDPARPPYPTSLDLYGELRAAAPPDMHYLLKDLFEDITFWDLKATKIAVQAVGAEQYRVKLDVFTDKLKADPTGKEKAVPMSDAIEIAVFDAGGKALYRQPHRVRSGAQTITLTVKAKRPPASAELDPDHELLDRRPDDNLVNVTED